MFFSVFVFVIFFFNKWEIEIFDVVVNVNYEVWVRLFCCMRIYFMGVVEEIIEVLLIDLYIFDRKC